MPARRQGRLGGGEAGGAVEPVVFGAEEAIGAIVDIEQDGIERRAGGDGGAHVALVHGDARIVEALPVDGRERAGPGDDGRHEFGHGDLRLGAEGGERRAQGEPMPRPPMRMRARGRLARRAAESVASCSSEPLMRLFISPMVPDMMENSLPRCMSVSLPPPGMTVSSSFCQGIMDGPERGKRAQP